jgi:hypothetical protein
MIRRNVRQKYFLGDHSRSRDKENKNPMGSTGDLNAESRHVLRMKASQERREQARFNEKERPGYGRIW